MAEVPPQPMTATAADVAGAIIAAYRQLTGTDPPSKTSWLFPLALSANETANWKSFYSYNLGNVTTAGGVDYYFNPHVTNGLKFISYDSLQDGALGMLRTLHADGGLAAADAGDQSAFQTALNAYLGGAVYPDLSAKISQLSSTVPSSGSFGTSMPIVPLAVAVGLATVAVWGANRIVPGSVKLPAFLPQPLRKALS